MPISRSELWKAAFEEMKSWTQRVQSLPARDVIFERALKSARAAAYHHVGHGIELTDVANEITSFIQRNYDPTRLRHPPRTSRVQREAQDMELIKIYQDAKASGEPTSMRAIAKRSGRSASQVGRILRGNGIATSTHISIGEAGEQNHTARALSILDQLVPRDGVRYVRSQLLAEQFFPNDPPHQQSLLSALFETINGGCSPFHCYQRSEWVLLSRGRRFSDEQVDRKLASRRHSTTVAPRRMLDTKRSLVFRDLASAVAISNQQASGDDWSLFLRSFTLRTAEWNTLAARFEALKGVSPDAQRLQTLVCDDPSSLTTRVRMGLRLRSETSYLASISARVQGFNAWHACLHEILYLIEFSEGGGQEYAAAIWIGATFYRERIKLGLLHGRDEKHIDRFLAAARQSDETDEPLDSLFEIN